MSSFDEFWKACPRKVGKGSARQKFAKAVQSTDAVTLIEKMKRYAASVEHVEPRYIAHPTTWLNQQRWLDDDVWAEEDADLVKKVARWQQIIDNDAWKRGV